MTHRRSWFTVAVAAVLLLAGCSEAVLDSGSEAAWFSSVQDVRKDLPDGERARFDQALEDLADAPADGPAMSLRPASHVPNAALHGLTARQVMDIAVGRSNQSEAMARERARVEIAELEDRLAGVKAGQARRVDGVRIVDPSFSKKVLADENELAPFIRLTVDNGSDVTVKRIVAIGRLISPGREQPWLEQEFEFTMLGGVAPGARRETMLEPGPYSPWGQVQAPEDAAMDIRIVVVESTDGGQFLPSSEFSEAQARRLQALKAKY